MTAAVKNLLGGDSTVQKSRTPEIMADAAYIILTSEAKSTTDQCFIDDEVLASTQGPDMERYRVGRDVKEWELVADFFV